MLQAVDNGRVDACLTRAEWQQVIFAECPERSELLTMQTVWKCQTVKARILRNHSFEFVESVIKPFLAYAGFELQTEYSSYDDSLGLTLAGPADVELVWLDFERYRAAFDAAGLADWLSERIAALRSLSDAPILVTDWTADDAVAEEFNERLHALEAEIPAVYVAPQSAIASRLGSEYFDRRMASLTGTTISNLGCIATASAMGLQWLPALLRPRLKAIVLDLDNTLYSGVLGEDGIAGIVLTDGHRDLQMRLSALRQDGIFLALCSRNEAADVAGLFEVRKDFPLQLNDFSASAISWRDKADGIGAIAETLRIGVGAMLFVDDNPGELADAAARLPELRCLHAADTAETVRALGRYPGLFQWRASETDQLRIRDLAATKERAELADAATDPSEYLQSIGVQLDFARSPKNQIDRLHALSHKTNQFAMSLCRLPLTEFARRLDDPDMPIVSIHLRDRLSDSGVIGALLARRDAEVLWIDEICVSCRALGRQIEDVMILGAIHGLLEQWSTAPSHIAFAVAKAPRNAPARDWLARVAGRALADDDTVVMMAWDAANIAELMRSTPVKITWVS
jgi:FkbH-like protein